MTASARNLSIQRQFEAVAAEHTPRFRFQGSTAEDWRAWRHSLLPQVQATLGRTLEPVPRNAEVIAEWQEDGLIKRKFIFDVEKNLSVVGYVFRPEDASGPLPGILCCHGHGAFGKESVMGNGVSEEVRRNIALHNYDYGLQMARAGFVTIAIDWRGFGDRDDRRKPHDVDKAHGRDLCNIHYIRATILGMTMLGLNLHDARCTLDYLCDQDFVDPDRLGVMGLSFGGTMATWISITDARIKAADIICYSDRFADFAIRDTNFCGSQITPGLYELCDVPDLHGLIAPRPLLVEIGIHDECFLIDSAMSCYREVAKIYAAAGMSDKLELDLFGGPHAWGGNKSIDFFTRHLR
jgi:dienelactone hydrolase